MPIEFLNWFYFKAPREIIAIWGNYLTANLHYFSILLLLRTAFSPWHKDLEGYGRGFELARYARVAMMNGVSRGIGVIVRVSTILFGLAVETLILFAGLLFLVFWLALPFVVATILFISFRLIV